MRLMLRILHHWRTIAAVAVVFKILTILLAPFDPRGDFGSWTIGSSLVLNGLFAGRLPLLSNFGVYWASMTLLAPFFWVWTILPIEHPPLLNIVSYTTPAIYLVLLMKLPIFICDILTGILALRLVRKITHSERSCAILGLTWFANPFNIYWMYFFGSMDIIPITILLAALVFGMGNRWFRCGLSTAIAGLLRVAPFAVLPFFLPLPKTESGRVKLIIGFLFPLACCIALLYVTSPDVIAVIANVPAKQNYLLAFLGVNIAAGGKFVMLTPVLLLVQWYVVLRYWKREPNMIHLTCVPLLSILLGATIYGGSFQHFIWVSPLLSACVAIHPEESWIFALTFITASLSPAIYPISLWLPARELLDTFFAGAFYAMKAIYLVRLNLWNLDIS